MRGAITIFDNHTALFIIAIVYSDNEWYSALPTKAFCLILFPLTKQGTGQNKAKERREIERGK